MFRDSYVRTCSAEFDLGGTDLSVHLTNDAVRGPAVLCSAWRGLPALRLLAHEPEA